MSIFVAALATELAPARANTIIIDSGMSPVIPVGRRVGKLYLVGLSAGPTNGTQNAAAVAIRVMTDPAITG